MKKYNLAVVGLHFGRYMLVEHILKGQGAEYFDVVGVCDLDQKLTGEVAA